MTAAAIATMTPPEVDTILADLWTRRARARSYLANLIQIGEKCPHRRDDARIEQYRAEARDLTAQARPYEAEYDSRPWSRFFLVRASGGHIHSSMDCTTCYPTTQFGWLPTLSGLTEADAVAQEGEILCSICFPSAPVAWTSGISRADKEAKAERAAAKAAREAKKLEKALLPDGSPLVVLVEGRPERVETLHAAKAWLTDAAEWNRHYPRTNQDGTVSETHPSFPHEAEQIIAAAVAAKTGETVEVVLAAAQKRAEKRS